MNASMLPQATAQTASEMQFPDFPYDPRLETAPPADYLDDLYPPDPAFAQPYPMGMGMGFSGAEDMHMRMDMDPVDVNTIALWAHAPANFGYVVL